MTSSKANYHYFDICFRILLTLLKGKLRDVLLRLSKRAGPDRIMRVLSTLEASHKHEHRVCGHRNMKEEAVITMVTESFRIGDEYTGMLERDDSAETLTKTARLIQIGLY